MRRKLKHFIGCCVLLLCCAGPAGASSQDPDSLYSESSVVVDSFSSADAASDTSYEEDVYADEPLPSREIIYNKQTPSEARWLEATSDDAYSYRTKSEYVKKPPPPRREDPGWIRLLLAFLRFFTTTAGKVVLWTLLILIVGYIVYRVITGEGGLFGKRDIRQEAGGEMADLSEEGLMELDWQSRMREALAANDRRQAIRFGYLHLLQLLQARELISFRPDKTNIAYYRELSETYRPAFRGLSRTYEAAWYGGFLPDDAGMDAYLTSLDKFLQSVPRS